jgi:hypothetical protein
MNIVLDYMKQDNKFLNSIRNEINDIVSIMNIDGRNTTSNILSFFSKKFNSKYKNILNYMSTISPISSFDFVQLDRWIDNARKIPEKDFLVFFDNLYSKFFTYGRKTSKPSPKTIKQLYSGNDNFRHGYIIYPMGSYIVSYLNDTEKYLDALNGILNLAGFVSEVKVDLKGNTIKITITPFNKKRFKFSYNSMTKSPNNRPIGFR